MIKILAIAVIGAILSLTVRTHRPELGLLCAVATGALVLVLAVPVLKEALAAMEALAARYSINDGMITVAIKVTGLAYLGEFTIQTCKDAGENAIAAKIEAAVKICLLSLCVPLAIKLLTELGQVLI
ncbi:MAG: hypothetical protein IJP30_03010 [Clostridia bacterium]|nr:hypothetical protein [Clostridia bacterium]